MRCWWLEASAGCQRRISAGASRCMTDGDSLSCCWRTPDLTAGCSLLDCRTCHATTHLMNSIDSTVGVPSQQVLPSSPVPHGAVGCKLAGRTALACRGGVAPDCGEKIAAVKDILLRQAIRCTRSGIQTCTSQKVTLKRLRLCIGDAYPEFAAAECQALELTAVPPPAASHMPLVL